MADSDPKLAPHNVESAGFKGGEVKGQYDVSAQARKKLPQTLILVNLHSLLAKKYHKINKDPSKGSFFVSK